MVSRNRQIESIDAIILYFNELALQDVRKETRGEITEEPSPSKPTKKDSSSDKDLSSKACDGDRGPMV